MDSDRKGPNEAQEPVSTVDKDVYFLSQAKLYERGEGRSE